MKKKILLLLVSAFLGTSVASELDIESIPTSKCSLRTAGVTPNMVLINWSVKPTVNEIVELYQTVDASNHFVTEPDRAIQMVDPITHASWGAGGVKNEWEKSPRGLNQQAITLTMVHPGFPEIGETQAREFVPFDEGLFTTTAHALQKICGDFGIAPRYVLGHGDVGGFADGADQAEITRYGENTPRKHAPGPLFPWGRLHHEYGIGAWLNPEEFNAARASVTGDVSELLNYMEEYGYPVILAEELSARNVRSIKTAGAHFWSNINNGGTGADYDQLPTDYRDATAWMYGLVLKYVRTSS